MSVKQVQSLGKRFKDFTNKRDFNIAGSDIAVPTDEQAQLKTQIESNTTPLGVSATYTGVGFDTMAYGVNYTWLTGIVVSNQAGTLRIHQSVDGTNWIETHALPLNANSTLLLDHTINLRHIRLVLANGATAQTSLQLQAYVTFK